MKNFQDLQDEDYMRSYVNNAKKIGQKLGLDKIERNLN
jgi:hypothetical protein